MLLERVIVDAENSEASEIKTRELVEVEKVLSGIGKRIAMVKVISKEADKTVEDLEAMFDE